MAIQPRNSMILNMLKTPKQVRDEQLQQLRERSLQQAEILSQPVRGTTALPDILSGFGASIRSNIEEDTAQSARRLTQGLGGLLSGVGQERAGQALRQATVTPEERRAGQVQQAMQGLQMGNVNSMKETLKKMQDANAPIEAILELSDRIATREKEILDRAASVRGEQLQRDMFGLKKRQIELDEAKFAAEELLGGTLGEFDLSTPEGVTQAVQELMARGKIAEAIRLQNAFKKEQSAAQRTIEYFANTFFDGDREQAFQRYMEMQTTSSMTGKQFDRLNVEYDKALASKNQLVITNAALRDLDQTDPILGSFAKSRLGATRLVGQVFGLEDETKAATQTEALLAKVRNMSAEKLGSGIFGSGTGISEKDMEEAKAIAGASESLTPEGMAFILRFNARLERAKLMSYNARQQARDSSFWNRIGQPLESYTVDVPTMYETPVTTANAEAIYENPQTGEQIYLYQNRWYNPDGTFYARNEGNGAPE